MEKRKRARKKSSQNPVDGSEFQDRLLSEYRTAVKNLQGDLRSEKRLRKRDPGDIPAATAKSLQLGLSELRDLLSNPKLDRGKLILLADKLAVMACPDQTGGTSDDEEGGINRVVDAVMLAKKKGERYGRPPSESASAPVSPRGTKAIKVFGRRSGDQATRAFGRFSGRSQSDVYSAASGSLPRRAMVDRSTSQIPVRASETLPIRASRKVSLSAVLSGMDLTSGSSAPTFPSREPSDSSVSSIASIIRELEGPPHQGSGNAQVNASLTGFMRPPSETAGPPTGYVLLRSRSLPALPSWDLSLRAPESSEDTSKVSTSHSGLHSRSGGLIASEDFNRMLEKSRRLSDESQELAKAIPDGLSPDLLFENTVDNKEILVAGKIEAVIDYLNMQNGQCKDDLDSVLLTHVRFISSQTLLSLFAAPFIRAAGEQKKKQLTNLNSHLCFWLKAYPTHFTERRLRDAFTTLVDTDIRALSASAAEYLNKLLNNRLQAMAEAILSNAPPAVMDVRFPMLELLSVHPRDIARELTLRESRCFNSMSANCLVEKIREENPTVVRVVDLFNKVSHWAATEVLATACPKKKASVIVHLISVAKYLQGMNNYASMMQIVSGLSMKPVTRLKKPWKIVPKKVLQKLEKMREVLEPEKNYAAYKKCMADCSLPAIPYVGIFLRNATLIEDGNSSVMKNGMVNMEKIRMLGLLVREVRYFQLSEYRFKRSPRGRQLVETMKPVTQTDALYALSYHSEPRVRRI